MVVDLGEIYPYQKVKKTIDISSYFDEDSSLIINSSCHCTAAKANSVSGSTILSVTLTANDEIGPYNKSIKVVNEKNRVLNIFIRSTISKVWDITPSKYIIFEGIPPLVTSNKEYVITNLKNEETSVTEIEYAEKNLRVEATSIDDRKHSITLALTPPLEATKLIDEIKIHTTSKLQPIVTINLFATIKNVVYADPEKVFFGTLLSLEKETKTITILSDSLEDFKIERIETKGNEIEYSIDQKQKNKYEINLTFIAPEKKGLIHDRILI